MGNSQNEEIEIDLKQLFYALMDKIWIIILATVIGIASVGMYTMLWVQPVYSSTSMMYILSQSTSITSLADIQLGSQLTSDYVVLVTSRPVVNKVIEELDLDMSYEQLAGMISVSNPSDTRILNLTVKNNDAYMAKTIVDKLTDVVVERVAEIMATEEPSVVDYGNVATAPTSPSIKKNAVIGGLLGLFASAGVIVVLFLLNDSIRTTDDIERYLGIQALGVIPLEGGETKRQYNAKRRKYLRSKKKMKKTRQNA